MDRQKKIDSILQHSRLVTPSAVAIRVVNATSNPDCTTAEITSLLSQDPVLCGKVLKAVNSCIFGGNAQPVATVDRAVVMLGLNPLRSLVLGLSLPIAQSKPKSNPGARDFWINAVSGGMLVKELSALRQGNAPGYDLVAGLLRDLGFLLMMQDNPNGWDRLQQVPIAELLADRCGVEESIFGVHHVEVTTALLTSWKLPNDVVEPIRFHHNLKGISTAKKSLFERAELLNFVESLVRLDAIAESPELLKGLLATAKGLFGLSQQSFIEFLVQVSPKIDEVKKLFDLDVQDTHDYSAILSRGCEALVELSLPTQFNSIASQTDTALASGLGNDPMKTACNRPRTMAEAEIVAGDSPATASLPRFNLSYLTKFPATHFLLDQFEIRSELGRGAMGIVYSGFDNTIHREVAIKIMSPEFASSQVARLRFQREARTLAAVQHQNIISIYNIGTAEGLPYIAMEYIHGGSLEDLVEGVGPLPVEQVVELGSQIAIGLAAAHRKGILHRDIKPANIMIEAISSTIKIGDFGIACGIDNFGLTDAGALMGSPLFLSPEQIEGHDIDARSDLFSLGSVLYFMCTGTYPFAAKSMAAIVRLICDATPISMRAFRSDLPEWLDSLVFDLLKRKPDDRIASAEHLYARLSKWKSHMQMQLQPV